MPVASSQYWNGVHGRAPGEAAQDAEGLQTLRTLGRNLAYFLKCRQLAQEQGCYKLMLMTGSKRQSTLHFYERAGYRSDVKTAFLQWL